MVHNVTYHACPQACRQRMTASGGSGTTWTASDAPVPAERLFCKHATAGRAVHSFDAQHAWGAELVQRMKRSAGVPALLALE